MESRDLTKGPGKPMANKGVSVLNFILRIVAFVCTLRNAIAMGTTNETLPFLTQFIRFRARFDDLPHSLAHVYLILSSSLSFFCIVKSGAQNSRIISVILDTVVLAFVTAGAQFFGRDRLPEHKWNTRTNWFSICQQYNSFCERISGSLIGLFDTVVILVVLILLSAVTLSRH